MMNNPKYTFGSVVYLKESAALGFLEAVTISGVHATSNSWLYTINASLSPPSPGNYLDRRSMVNTQQLYYSEDEFVTKCDAYVLAEANAKATYDRIKATRRTFCPDLEITSGTD